MVKTDSSSNSKDSDYDYEVNSSYNELFNKHKEMLGKLEKLAEKYKGVEKNNYSIRKEKLNSENNLEKTILELNESKITSNSISHDCLECSLYREMNEILTNKLEVLKNWKWKTNL